MNPIAIDFETFYIDKEYSLKEMGASAYIRDPRFDPYLISVSDGADTWAGHPKDFNWDALDSQTLLSHNAGFDSRVYRRMVQLGLAPQVNHGPWHCTANLTTYLCMRRDLARASEFLLGVAADKSYRVDANGRRWEDMVKAGVDGKVKEAGRVDALRCHQFWSKFGHLWPERERALSDLTIRQCARGVQMDTAKLQQFIFTAQQMLIQAETNLPWMKEGKKPTSPKAVAEECRKHGIPMPPVKSRDGEDAYDEWAGIYGPKHSWVKAYTDYRVINKFLSTLETLKSRLDPSDTFYYDLLYFGAHTGRWSGSGGYNMQNMRKEPLYCDVDGWLVTDEPRLKEIRTSKTLPGFVAHVLDIRALFIARPGKKLIISDLSQIEPRVLAWMAGDKAMLAKMAAGNSPYQAHAESSMNWTRGDMKQLIKDGHGDVKDIYQLAKARVLGLGFGCGWEKFITVAMNLAGIDITKDDPELVPAPAHEDGSPALNADGTQKMVSGYGYNSRRIVNDYRESNPLIAGKDGIWKKLDTAFRESVGRDFSITLPSGRTLRYPEVQREFKAVADPEKPGKWSKRWVITALAFDQKRNSVVRKPFYGGILTENAVQATARDVFGEHLITLDRTSGIDVLWSEHDAAVNEVDMSVTTRDVETIMSRCPDWLAGCPIAAEAIESPCYVK